MSFFQYVDGHIDAEYNGRKALDTRAPMLNLVPDAAIELTNFEIEFPDLWKGTIYRQGAQADQFSGSVTDSCSTFIGLVEQEWGPSQPSPRTLPDVTIGSVPAGTDYLEIWVNLTRTRNPANILDLALEGSFPEGQWVKLDGHSCVVEELMGVARQFEFVLSGTSVRLRRLQSVVAGGGPVSSPVRRETGGASSVNKTFFFPGNNAPVDSSKYAVYGAIIDTKIDRNGPTHRPSGYESGSSWNVPCSMSHSGKSYASTWTGTVRIKPGYINQ